jgi:hypothetical protein
MPVRNQDWNAVKLAFISDPTKPDLKTFCETRKISYKTTRTRAGKEKWIEIRDTHWNTVGTKSQEQIIDMQATILSRDIAQRLTEIRAMSDKAYRAILPANGKDGLEFEKASDAVNAYEKLSKLERDLSKPDDKNSITLDMLDRILERYGVELVRAVNEHIRDAPARAALLRTIEERWSNIPIVESDPARAETRGSAIN